MGGASNIRAPKPQPQEYTPVFQKDGNYYKREAPKQSEKGKANNQRMHNGNPMKATQGKGKASLPTYTQIDGGMSHTADMGKSSQANRFQIGDYRGQSMMGSRQPAGRRPKQDMAMKPSSSKNQMAPYRGGVGSMIGKGMF